MKLLRDSFHWRALRRRLFADRAAARRTYVVTVPAPLAGAASEQALPPTSTGGMDITVAPAVPVAASVVNR